MINNSSLPEKRTGKRLRSQLITKSILRIKLKQINSSIEKQVLLFHEVIYLLDFE